MGANAQTTVPTFTASQVLTADQQNQSARTGVPVFATTVTRDAAFGGSGEKTLAEGQLAYIEASDVVQYYDGAAWATLGPASAGALTLITTGTLSAAASVTVNTCFTSTYDEYLLLVDVTGSASASLTLQMRNAGSTITASNYQWFRTGFNKDGATDNAAAEGQSSWLFGYLATIPSVFAINIFSPLDNANQQQSAFGASTNAANSAAAIYSTGMRYNQNQVFDSFVMSASSGNMTGTVRVYGYSK